MSAETRPNCILGNGSCLPDCELIETARRTTTEQGVVGSFFESVSLYQAPEISDMCAREQKMSKLLIQVVRSSS